MLNAFNRSRIRNKEKRNLDQRNDYAKKRLEKEALKPPKHIFKIEKTLSTPILPKISLYVTKN